MKASTINKTGVADSFVAPAFRQILSLHERKKRDDNPGQWLLTRSTTSAEYSDIVEQSITSTNVEVKNFFTEWSNELIAEDVSSAMWKLHFQMLIDERVKYGGGTYSGSFNDLTFDETVFIFRAIVLLGELTEIYAVNELGYTDIWLVFPGSEGNEHLEHMEVCRKSIEWHGLRNISYLILHPDNFTSDVSDPLLHITMGGA